MTRYVGAYDGEGLRIIGPFADEAAAVEWGETKNNDDPRWFTLPDIAVAENGMVENEPIDQPFVAIRIENPENL